MTDPFEFQEEILVEDADSYTDAADPRGEPEPIDLREDMDEIQPPDFRPPLQRPEEPENIITGGNKTRPRGAQGYEKRLRKTFAWLIRATAANPRTLPDSAALILATPQVSRSLGDLAAEDERIGRVVKALTDTSQNVYVQTFTALGPLLGQLVRNHEPAFEPKVRAIRIPVVGWRIRIPKVGISIHWLRGLRTVTEEPSGLADFVFSDERVQAAFDKYHVPLAYQRRK